MLLSQYCKDIKPYIETTCEQINSQGSVKAYFNDQEYHNTVDFLDGCVLSLCEYIMQGELERDIDLSEAFRQSGILDGYLQNTNIMSRVVKDQNPLRGVFK